MRKEKMNAAVLKERLTIGLEQVKRPVPGPDEALIQVACIGICGSDVHYYEHGRIGRYVVEQPLILGHEAAGTVVEVGANVTRVAVGDRVAIEPGVTCGYCEYCKSGRYNLCPDVRFLATPPVHGAWAEYLAIRADLLFKIPDTMSFEEGALLEPLSVGYHAMNRAQVKPNDKLLIVGLGPIGLLAIQAAQLFGVKEIYACDVIGFRREFAKKLGAAAVFDPSAHKVEEELLKLTGGSGIDVIVESSGNRQAISNAVKWVKRGGRIVFIGLPPEKEAVLDIDRIIDSELDLYGLFRYANTYEAAIQTYSSSDLDIQQIITHRYPLRNIAEAMEVARVNKEQAIKIMIYPEA